VIRLAASDTLVRVNADAPSGTARLRPTAAAVALVRWAAERDWTGPDPYEGLNATRMPFAMRRNPWGRRLVIQTVKRSPVDLRRLLGIRPGRNAVALGSFVASYARNGFLPEEAARTRLRRTLTLLREERSPGFEEACWGYHFDVQTRVFFYPRGAPNTIATAFAALGLLDAYERTGTEEALALALGAGDFFLRHVPQTGAGRGAYFGYLAGDRTPIHNANMLASAVLARLWRHSGRADLLHAARAGVEYTVGLQRPDGSWPYGERRGLSWVDNFHTGYVLDCLMECLDAGIDRGTGDALSRGLLFYRDALFLADGTPKYTSTSTYPIDVQCAAQGIQTFARAAARGLDFGDNAWAVYRYAIARLLRDDGAFVFQRRRLWTNRTPHVRWGAAPMLLALTHLIASSEASA
jgi:hypothetical protein